MFLELQRAIPYHFTQVKLLTLALTHSSAANEQYLGDEHNERLEFLGDAVLELCISQELYKRFPEAREGQLTAMRSKLVNQDTLAILARKIKLDAVLILGKGEESQGGRSRDSLLSDAFEAMLGAIFQDGGFTAVQQVIALQFADLWPQPDEKKKNKDNKSRLQEITQQIYKDRPVYALVDSQGPEHAKVFFVKLELPDGRVFIGQGSSVKRAEQSAAAMALDVLQANGAVCDDGTEKD